MARGEQRIEQMRKAAEAGEVARCPKEDERFVQLVEDVNQALAETEIVLASCWMKGAQTDWRAAQALLAVRHKARWSQGGIDHTARGRKLIATIYLPDNGRDTDDDAPAD